MSHTTRRNVKPRLSMRLDLRYIDLENYIRYGHGVVLGCFTLRDDDSIRRPFDAPLIVVNYFYHEEVKESAEM